MRGESGKYLQLAYLFPWLAQQVCSQDFQLVMESGILGRVGA